MPIFYYFCFPLSQALACEIIDSLRVRVQYQYWYEYEYSYSYWFCNRTVRVQYSTRTVRKLEITNYISQMLFMY